MRYYSLPADFKKETIDQYSRLNDSYQHSRVNDTYGNINVGNFFGSGRLVRQTPKVDMYDLRDYIAYSEKKGIGFNYTLNATHLHNQEFTGEGAAQIRNFLGQIYNAGVRSITVSLPSLIELIQSTPYEFNIRVSCLCQITNANRALAYKKMGVYQIVVEESINRDFFALKRIREAFGEKVEIIVNQICDKNCMYRMFHYNMIAGDPMGTTNKVSINYYEHRCVLQQLKSIDNLLKLCWIRPEDIKYYTDIGIIYFKLQGRHTFVQGGDPIRTVKSYFEESFDGNLMDLLTMFAKLTGFSVYVDNKKLENFIKPFVEKECFCKNTCSDCRYCQTWSKKCINEELYNKVVKMASEFYKDFDQYQTILNSLTVKEKKLTQNSDEDCQQEKYVLLDNSHLDKGDFSF
jgi:collagenase-like PrtC family protease